MLNSIFSKSDFSLDEGEVLLKDMQDMRDELTKVSILLKKKQKKSSLMINLHSLNVCNLKMYNSFFL